MQDKKDKGMYKVVEVAQKLNVHRNTVLNLIKRGEISAVKVGDTYRIPENVYKNFVNAGGTA